MVTNILGYIEAFAIIFIYVYISFRLYIWFWGYKLLTFKKEFTGTWRNWF